MRLTDPDTGETTDAVGAFLEHTDAEPVEVYLPYERRRLRGYSFGELWARAGERRVFIEA